MISDNPTLDAWVNQELTAWINEPYGSEQKRIREALSDLIIHTLDDVLTDFPLRGKIKAKHVRRVEDDFLYNEATASDPLLFLMGHCQALAEGRSQARMEQFETAVERCFPPGGEVSHAAWKMTKELFYALMAMEAAARRRRQPKVETQIISFMLH